jgi:hypothetical protein
MKLSDTVHIPAPPQTVWRGLNDPELLKAAIPGCKSIEKVSDTEFNASAAVTFGPVKATFGGKVKLSDLDPPHGYRISGEGAGGAAGFANGSAVVRLTPQGDGTDLSYEVEASVGGKIAQIGQRFIDQAAKKMADDFFARFAAAVAPSAATSATPNTAPAAAAASEPPPAIPPAAAAASAPQRQELSPAEKLAKQMREAGMPLAPGPQEFAEMKRNLPVKFIILALALAIVAAIAIFKH